MSNHNLNKHSLRLYSEFLKANAELLRWNLEIQEINDGLPGDIDLSFSEFKRWGDEVQRLTDELNLINFWEDYEEEPF